MTHSEEKYLQYFYAGKGTYLKHVCIYLYVCVYTHHNYAFITHKILIINTKKGNNAVDCLDRLDKYITKVNAQVANKHMKLCSIAFVLRKFT